MIKFEDVKIINTDLAVYLGGYTIIYENCGVESQVVFILATSPKDAFDNYLRLYHEPNFKVVGIARHGYSQELMNQLILAC